jgi:tRNA 2-thiouridine synthesizing protein D
MAKSVLVLITKPPYGFEEAFAGSRLALGMVSSGNVENCNLLLVGDGTLNAVATQKPEILRMPSNMEALQDMTEMEFKVYCVKQDLDERAPGASVLNLVEMVDWEKARKIIDEHQMVTTF